MLHRTPFLIAAAALAAILLLPLAPATPCLHQPEGYKGSMVETSQQAIIFFDSETAREELIIRISYEETSDERLSNLAWVVPVPTAPDGYAVESPDVFKEVFDFVEQTKDQLDHEADGGLTWGMESDGIELLQKVTVGEYEIQPIRGRGANAGPALNEWLKANGYGQVPIANMQWYLDRNWTFLATKILDVTFRPLRISFATPQLVYPLKFSSHQGEFAVTLHLITAGPLPRRELRGQLAQFGFEFSSPDCPATLESKRLGRYPALQALWRNVVKDKRIGFSTGVITQLRAWSVNNEEDSPVSAWTEDFHLDLEPVSFKCDVPGHWALAAHTDYDEDAYSASPLRAFDSREHDFHPIGTTPGEISTLRRSAVCFRVNDNVTDKQLAGLSALATVEEVVGLDLSRCESLSAKGMLAVVPQLRHLRALALVGCEWMTDKTLLELANMPRLYLLDVRHCPAVTEDGVAALNDAVVDIRGIDAEHLLDIRWGMPEPEDEDEDEDGDGD